jgi:hypothetical protein
MARTAEGRRLEEAWVRTARSKRWGPYLSGRAWGTVREDYSADGGQANSAAAGVTAGSGRLFFGLNDDYPPDKGGGLRVTVYY